MQLIGIAGTNGSGKDTVGQVLADNYKFLFISVTDILREELVRRGLPIERENLRQLSAEWRRQSGLGVLIDRAIAIYEQQPADRYLGLAIASLRNPGEVMRVHELHGKVLWLDADPAIRYQRVQAHTSERGAMRATEDRKSYQQFLDEEKAEMQHSGDAATLSMADVKKEADIFITNEGDDLKVFSDQVADALGLVQSN